MELIPGSLSLAWFCDLLWPMECARNAAAGSPRQGFRGRAAASQELPGGHLTSTGEGGLPQRRSGARQGHDLSHSRPCVPVCPQLWDACSTESPASDAPAAQPGCALHISVGVVCCKRSNVHNEGPQGTQKSWTPGASGRWDQPSRRPSSFLFLLRPRIGPPQPEARGRGAPMQSLGVKLPARRWAWGRCGGTDGK